LKSAAFTQGDTLEVLSSRGKMSFIKYRTSLKEILERGVYGTERLDLTDEDTALIQDCLSKGRGTIIRIADIRQSNNYSISAIVNEVNDQIGDLYSPAFRPRIEVSAE
jgi:hypothetical protein